MKYLHRIFSFGFFSRTEHNFDCPNVHTNSFMLNDRISFDFMNFHLITCHFVYFFCPTGAVKPLSRYMYLYWKSVYTKQKHKISVVLINRRLAVVLSHHNLVNEYLYFIWKKATFTIAAAHRMASKHTSINWSVSWKSVQQSKHTDPYTNWRYTEIQRTDTQTKSERQRQRDSNRAAAIATISTCSHCH